MKGEFEMLQALDELFGRSTVDPQVQEAFESGHIETILVECGFPTKFAIRLAGRTADSLEEFLALVFREVHDQLTVSELQVHRWPTEGLAESDEAERGSGKSPGIHQAA